MDDFKEIANRVGERLFSGATCALEEVIDLYQQKVYNLAYRFTYDTEEACDLSQEIFLRVYGKIHRFTPGTDFNAWFMRLAVNAAINYRSKTRRNPARIALALNEEVAVPVKGREGDHLDTQAFQDTVYSLLADLPARERMVITLQLWENKKVREIADLLDTSVKSVESMLTRARKRLKKIFKKNEGFL